MLKKERGFLRTQTGGLNLAASAHFGNNPIPADPTSVLYVVSWLGVDS